MEERKHPQTIIVKTGLPRGNYHHSNIKANLNTQQEMGKKTNKMAMFRKNKTPSSKIASKTRSVFLKKGKERYYFKVNEPNILLEITYKSLAVIVILHCYTVHFTHISGQGVKFLILPFMMFLYP